MIVKQIRSTDGTGTLSYLLIDQSSKSGVVIDPNMEDVKNLVSLVRENGVTVTHVIDTHTHVDHISGADELRKTFGAKIVMHENTKNKWKFVDQGDKFGIGDTLRANAKIPVDLYVNHSDVVNSGSMNLKMLFTPGHTDNHLSVLADDCLFTGDLLLIGQAGRSDLPGGNPEDQYKSLFHVVLALPDATKIYPGHDYENNVFALLGDEKKSNPFLQVKSKHEYVAFVNEFFPPLAESVSDGKMTLQCGAKRVPASNEPFKNIGPKELAVMLKENPSLFLLDVREPFELTKNGAIPGVKNIPVGEIPKRINELPSSKSTPIVSICHTGGRSYEIAHYLATRGYTNVYNLEGGTSAWIRGGQPVHEVNVTHA